MSKLINCPKSRFDELCRVMQPPRMSDPNRDLATEKIRYELSNASRLVASGLVPEGLFRNYASGEEVNPVTFLLAYRANFRGRLALGRLLSQKIPHVKRVKDDPTPRLTYTPEQYAEAMREQQSILDNVEKRYPGFFNGCLEEDEGREAYLARNTQNAA
jgi:hypothetical protein